MSSTDVDKEDEEENSGNFKHHPRIIEILGLNIAVLVFNLGPTGTGHVKKNRTKTPAHSLLP